MTRPETLAAAIAERYAVERFQWSPDLELSLSQRDGGATLEPGLARRVEDYATARRRLSAAQLEKARRANEGGGAR